MKPEDIIRAWKDEDYLRGLTAEQLSVLPDNPAGPIEAAHLLSQAFGGNVTDYSSGGTFCNVTDPIGCPDTFTDPSCGSMDCVTLFNPTCSIDPSTGTCYS
jgi:mersacidin/lichenicidin family type 2 lantibiotic